MLNTELARLYDLDYFSDNGHTGPASVAGVLVDNKNSE